jgi:hypothetical protein
MALSTIYQDDYHNPWAKTPSKNSRSTASVSSTESSGYNSSFYSLSDGEEVLLPMPVDLALDHEPRLEKSNNCSF